MIEHMVLLKFKPEVDQAHRAKVIAALTALKTRIPGILDLTAGENFCDRAQGHQVGLFVRFKDKEALAAYQPHPEHVAVVTGLIRPYVDNVIALDYEA